MFGEGSSDDELQDAGCGDPTVATFLFESCVGGGAIDETYDEAMSVGTYGHTVTTAEKEVGLLELAKCAARAKHYLHDVAFDESTEIDVVNEIKFSVIIIALPLGLLFQENSGGCWVTGVFENGNAANCRDGNGVEVGDQLAGVNGNSTIKMKVDEICTMISESPNPKEIELTFIRYVGAIRPSQNGQVRDQYNEGGSNYERSLKFNRPKSPRKNETQKMRFRLFGRKRK